MYVNIFNYYKYVIVIFVVTCVLWCKGELLAYEIRYIDGTM
jgi:hypothetical protein